MAILSRVIPRVARLSMEVIAPPPPPTDIIPKFAVLPKLLSLHDSRWSPRTWLLRLERNSCTICHRGRLELLQGLETGTCTRCLRIMCRGCFRRHSPWHGAPVPPIANPEHPNYNPYAFWDLACVRADSRTHLPAQTFNSPRESWV